MGIMIFGLALSGITAFPLETELSWLAGYHPWFNTVYTAIADVNARYPFLSYGTDWLAFAHLMLGDIVYRSLQGSG